MTAYQHLKEALELPASRTLDWGEHFHPHNTDPGFVPQTARPLDGDALARVMMDTPAPHVLRTHRRGQITDAATPLFDHWTGYQKRRVHGADVLGWRCVAQGLEILLGGAHRLWAREAATPWKPPPNQAEEDEPQTDEERRRREHEAALGLRAVQHVLDLFRFWCGEKDPVNSAWPMVQRAEGELWQQFTEIHRRGCTWWGAHRRSSRLFDAGCETSAALLIWMLRHRKAYTRPSRPGYGHSLLPYRWGRLSDTTLAIARLAEGWDDAFGNDLFDSVYVDSNPSWLQFLNETARRSRASIAVRFGRYLVFS